jgi:hypothetical protein
MQDTMVDVYVGGRVSVNNVRDDSFYMTFNELYDIKPVNAIHAIVWQVMKPHVQNAQYSVRRHGRFSQPTQFLSRAAPVASRLPAGKTFGKNNYGDTISGRNMCGHRSSAS